MMMIKKYAQTIKFIALISFIMSSSLSQAQVSIAAHNTDYTTNLNGWNNSLPTGFTRTGANYVGTSASTTGGVYAIANSGFDYQASGTSPATACSLVGTYKNTTGTAITSVQISYQAFQVVNRASRTPNWTVTSTLGSVAALSWTFNSGTTAASPDNKTVTLTGLNIANNGTFTITFASDRGAGSGSSPLIGLNNVKVRSIAVVSCTTPNAIAFQVQPSNVVQNATMTSVQVKAICTASGLTATSYTGPVTLTLNSPGCGYTAQTVNAVAGVATFSSVSILRSAQSGLNFTASASGFTSITSSNFNVTVPAGAATSTVVTQNNFDATTTWGYAAGTPSYSGSGSGNDDTGVKSSGGSNVLCKSFSNDNGSGEKGSTNTVTFNNVTGLATYSQVDFEFKVTSFGSGTGAGNDSGEDFSLDVSTDGGSTWTTIITESGMSNRMLALSASPITSLSLVNSVYGGGDSKSAFKLSLTGITQFNFRFTAENNRTNENWGIDDVKLTGITHTTGTAFNLPSATASAAAAICNTSEGIQLGVNVTSFQAPLTYSWTPTAPFDDPMIQNPMAYQTVASQTYTVTVVDGHNCRVTSTVAVTNPGAGGTPGLWTGAQSTDWFDCRNWDDFRVPESTTNVTINQTADDECIVDEFDAVCNNLTLTSNNGTANNLTLSTTGTLTAVGTLSITNTGSNNVKTTLQDDAQLICANLTIDGQSNGDAKLEHEEAATLVTVNGNLTIQPGGELDLSDGNNGTPGGIVQIKGNYINNATETDFKQEESTIVFNGTGNQDISIAGTAPEIFYNLTVNKISGTLTLSDDIRVSKLFTMTSGYVNTQASLLELGESTSEKGTLAYASGYVLGKMRRWFDGTNSGNASSLFPMGIDDSGMKNRHVSVEYTSAPSTGGNLTVEFMAVPMGMSGIPIASASSSGAGFDVTSTEDLGYWKIDNLTSTLTDGLYKITCTGEGFSTITDLSRLTLLKRVVASGPNWFCPGTHIGATGTAALPVLARSGVSGWSNFGFGGGTANPLPVELVSFSVKCEDHAVLSWSTASEHNSDYFSVQKTTDGITWDEMAKVQAAGNASQMSDYTYTDLQRERNTVYYRLVQVDFNGSATAYNPVSLVCGESDADYFSLYPNPNNGDFSIELNPSELSGTVSVSLSTADGKMIDTKTISDVNASGLLFFAKNELNKGIYFVTVKDENNSGKTVKIYVE